MKLIPAKCPNCGASLKINEGDEHYHCEFCNNDILVDDAVQKYKLEINANIEVTNIPKLNNYIKLAMMHYKDKEYEEALIEFNKAIELDPENFTLILRRGLCKSMLTNYADFDIESARNGFNNCMDVLHKNEADQNTINTIIIETKHVVDSLFVFARNYYLKHQLTFSDMNEYVDNLVKCIGFYVLLLSNAEKESSLSDSLITDGLSMIDCVLSVNSCYNRSDTKIPFSLDNSTRDRVFAIRDDFNSKKSPTLLELDEKRRVERNKKDLNVFLIILAIMLFISSLFYFSVNVLLALVFIATGIVVLPVFKSRKSDGTLSTGLLVTRIVLVVISVLIILISFIIFMINYKYPFVGDYSNDFGVKATLENYKLYLTIDGNTQEYKTSVNSSSYEYRIETEDRKYRAVYDTNDMDLCIVDIKDSSTVTTSANSNNNKKCTYLLKKDNN